MATTSRRSQRRTGDRNDEQAIAMMSRRSQRRAGDHNDEQVIALLVQLSTFARGKIKRRLPCLDRDDQRSI
jgi:hypothetical protein